MNKCRLLKWPQGLILLGLIVRFLAHVLHASNRIAMGVYLARPAYSRSVCVRVGPRSAVIIDAIDHRIDQFIVAFARSCMCVFHPQGRA